MTTDEYEKDLARKSGFLEKALKAYRNPSLRSRIEEAVDSLHERIPEERRVHPPSFKSIEEEYFHGKAFSVLYCGRDLGAILENTITDLFESCQEHREGKGINDFLKGLQRELKELHD